MLRDPLHIPLYSLHHSLASLKQFMIFSVMSGRYTGVQTGLKEVTPYATYIHFYAHLLNLVLVNCAKAIPHAAELFFLVESLYVFITATKTHAKFLSR